MCGYVDVAHLCFPWSKCNIFPCWTYDVAVFEDPTALAFTHNRRGIDCLLPRQEFMEMMRGDKVPSEVKAGSGQNCSLFMSE